MTLLLTKWVIAVAEMHKGYATALFELSSDEKTNEDLKEISAVFLNNADYVELLSTPTLPKKERLDLLKVALGDRFSPILTDFVLLMCEKGVLSELALCQKEYEKLYKESVKETIAYVCSAVVLSEEEKSKLKTRLEKISGYKVTLECSVDKKLMGGITVEIDGKFYDGSVKSRLDDIKKVINK